MSIKHLNNVGELKKYLAELSDELPIRITFRNNDAIKYMQNCGVEIDETCVRGEIFLNQNGKLPYGVTKDPNDKLNHWHKFLTFKNCNPE